MPNLDRVLVIEDDLPLCAAIARVARTWGAEVREAHTAAEARAHLREHPELVIADIRLPDGNAVELVEEASRLRPAPAIVAFSGQASAEEAFRLGQAGVRAYLSKPITPERLSQEVDAALARSPSLEPLARASVGHAPLREVQGRVREAMVDQALALEQESRSGAARLLRVSRQAVQQMVRGRTRDE